MIAAPTYHAEDRVRRLGRTDLSVSRIGIGCGSSISSDDLLYAVDRGLNYVFFSTDLHPQAYGPARAAIERLCRSGSPRRRDVVLALVSYTNDAEKLPAILVDQLHQTKIDYVDVFFWGWVSRRNRPLDLIDETRTVMMAEDARRELDRFFGVVREVGAELHARGYARYLGISTHDRLLASELSLNPSLDAIMFRYNIAHRGAEADILDRLAGAPDRIGTVAFNAGHNANGLLVTPPPNLPAGKYQPSMSDCYRYVLDRPDVDLLLAGPKTREHVDQAIATLERPPHNERMSSYLRAYGDLHCGRARV